MTMGLRCSDIRFDHIVCKMLELLIRRVATFNEHQLQQSFRAAANVVAPCFFCTSRYDRNSVQKAINAECKRRKNCLTSRQKATGGI